MTGKDGVQTLNDEKKEQRLEDPFDVFSVPAINDDYAYHDDHFIEPSTNVTQTGPIVFEFETSGGERFDSNYTELETHYQIFEGIPWIKSIVSKLKRRKEYKCCDSNFCAYKG